MLGRLIDDISFEVLSISARNYVATLGLLRVSKLDQKSFLPEILHFGCFHRLFDLP